MLLAFGRPPLDLRNTGLLIVLAPGLVAILFVVGCWPPLSGFDRRYLDAAAVLGRSPVRALAGVAVPLLLPAVVVAAGFAFAVTIGEFGATVFLASPADPDPAGGHLAAAGAAGEVTVAAAYAASAVLMLITASVVVGMDRVRLSRGGGVLMLTMTASRSQLRRARPARHRPGGRPWEIVCILGPSGGGKSTLLRAVAGLVDHTGSIAVAGRSLAGFRRIAAGSA